MRRDSPCAAPAGGRAAPGRVGRGGGHGVGRGLPRLRRGRARDVHRVGGVARVNGDCATADPAFARRRGQAARGGDRLDREDGARPPPAGPARLRPPRVPDGSAPAGRRSRAGAARRTSRRPPRPDRGAHAVGDARRSRGRLRQRHLDAPQAADHRLDRGGGHGARLPVVPGLPRSLDVCRAPPGSPRRTCVWPTASNCGRSAAPTRTSAR